MPERRLSLDSIDDALALLGSGDEHLKTIEKHFGVRAVYRGTKIKLSGQQEAIDGAVHTIQAMLQLLKNKTPLDEQVLHYCISLAEAGDEGKVQELTGDFVFLTAKGRPVRPKTLGQKAYLDSIRKNTVTFGVGPAGTGKTYLAVAMAVRAFKARQVSRIILTRPAVEAGEKLGFLPGDLQDKVDPYLRPLYDALFEMLGAENYQKLVEKGAIEVAPLAYMRGRTLDDSFIILDEAQNTTPEQMKMFLTRMGMNSKLVVNGDVTQIDLPQKSRSGLLEATVVLKNIEGIASIRLTDKDVVRHRLVQEIVRAYERASAKKTATRVRHPDNSYVVDAPLMLYFERKEGQARCIIKCILPTSRMQSKYRPHSYFNSPQLQRGIGD